MPKQRSTKHAQSAFEYLVTYGWALLILALVLVILFYFTSVPSKVVPNTCQFTTGAFCEDIVLGSVATTHATVVAFIATNLRKYPVMNPTLTTVQNGVNSTPVACSPDFVLPGGAIFCEVNTQIKSNPYQFVASSLYLSAVYCGFSATPGTPAGCANGGVRESYSGSFAGSTQPVSSASSLLSVSLSAANPVQPANGSADALTATVRLMGYPVTGASVGFNATYASNGTDALPPFALKSGFSDTNSTGAAVDSIWGSVPGNLTVTASYGNHSASVPIRFIPSVEVRFVPSNSLVANFSNCTTPIVSIDKTNYTLSEVAAKVFNWTVGTTHPFAFTTPFCSSTGSEKRGIFKSATVYGVIQPTPTGNITATTSTNVPFSYQQQYYLTTASNPALAGIISPASGWFNGSSKVTITETSNNSSTTKALFLNWTCSGVNCYNGTSQSSTIIMDSPMKEVANYLVFYYFAEGASPPSEGTVSPGSEWVEAGNTVTISETPTTTAPFSGWTCSGTGCYQGPDTSATIKIESPTTEMANYLSFLYCPVASIIYDQPFFAQIQNLPTAYTSLTQSGIGGWADTSQFPGPQNTTSTSCVTNSGYVYCVGAIYYDGAACSSFGFYSCIIATPVWINSNASYYASLSSGGIGGWASTNRYPVDVSPSCVSSGEYIYCVAPNFFVCTSFNNVYSAYGGIVSSTCTSSKEVPGTYYASLSSGGIGGWTPTNSPPIAQNSNLCVSSGGYAYCTYINVICTSYSYSFYGAKSCSSVEFEYIPVAYYAELSSGGIGGWISTTPYPFAAGPQYLGESAACATSNGYVYCVGGYDLSTGGNTNLAYFAKLSSSGMSGWTETNGYPTDMAGGSCKISNGYIYCVGGSGVVTGSSCFTTTRYGFGGFAGSSYTICNPVYSIPVYYAPVSSSGIGGWSYAGYYPGSSEYYSTYTADCVVSPRSG